VPTIIKASTRSTIIKASARSVVAIGALLCLANIADAGEPIALTDVQLDRVTGSGVTIASGSAATSQALWTSTQTNTSTIVARVPGAETQGGLASGTAVSYGTNFANTNAPPPSQNTNVSTDGTVGGNLVVTTSNNTTLSALGLTIQTGFTSVYGAVGLGF
jgi:hypothetical protein